MAKTNFKSFLFLGFSAAIPMCMAQAAGAQEGLAPNSVTVQGECERQVIADRGSITVTAAYREPQIRDATQKAQAAYRKVKEAVEKLDLKDVEIRTTEYTVQEVREWVKDRSVSKGFEARLGLQISTSQVQRLGEVIAIASREGIQDVGGLQSFLSRQKLVQEQLECLKETAENGRAKAERLARSLGAKLGEVVSIQEEGMGADLPRPVPMMRAEMAKSMDQAPPVIEGGTQKLNMRVITRFELKR